MRSASLARTLFYLTQQRCRMVIPERRLVMALPSRVSRLAEYDPIELAQWQFDNVLGRLFGGRELETNGWAPYGVDVREDVDHVYVEAELPGFRKEDVDLTLENSTLTITAERKGDTRNDGKQGEWLLRERRFNRVV